MVHRAAARWLRSRADFGILLERLCMILQSLKRRGLEVGAARVAGKIERVR
jgi:hypothetical protein